MKINTKPIIGTSTREKIYKNIKTKATKFPYQGWIVSALTMDATWNYLNNL